MMPGSPKLSPSTTMSETYPLASTERERRRLEMQSQALVPLTERMLSGASITAGARVIELGCGSGEVTRLIASRVGPGGKVLALDRDRRADRDGRPQAGRRGPHERRVPAGGHRDVRDAREVRMPLSGATCSSTRARPRGAWCRRRPDG
jgi:cyclopropane fatty-acyl-phospholipid synthase-like methyltransferase